MFHPAICLGFSMINPARNGNLQIIQLEMGSPGSPISGKPRSRQGWFVNANSLVGAPSDGYAVAVEDGEVREWGALNGRWFNSG